MATANSGASDDEIAQLGGNVLLFDLVIDILEPFTHPTLLGVEPKEDPIARPSQQAMAKRNRERAKQAKRKAKEERKAQREADKLNRPTELDEFGNPIELSGDLDETAEPEADGAPDASPDNQ